jgi:DNA-directed RNA polymerase I, II, and III subunit RPABC2
MKDHNNAGLPREKRVTTAFMTRYELARVIGTRAQQIASGAPIQVELTPDLDEDPLNIAAKELKAGKIDMIIRRNLPNDRFEDWHVRELILEDEDGL